MLTLKFHSMMKKFTRSCLKHFFTFLIAASPLMVLAQSGIYGGRPIVKGFRLYPNPVTSELRLAADEDLSGTLIQVFDLLGKAVMSARNIASRLDVSRLSPGVYTLIFNRNGHVITKQFVKQ